MLFMSVGRRSQLPVIVFASKHVNALEIQGLQG